LDCISSSNCTLLELDNLRLSCPGIVNTSATIRTAVSVHNMGRQSCGKSTYDNTYDKILKPAYEDSSIILLNIMESLPIYFTVLTLIIHVIVLGSLLGICLMNRNYITFNSYDDIEEFRIETISILTDQDSFVTGTSK